MTPLKKNVDPERPDASPVESPQAARREAARVGGVGAGASLGRGLASMGQASDGKVANIHDPEIGPLWTDRFARLLLRVVHEGLGEDLGQEAGQPPPQKSTALDVMCGTGSLTLAIIGAGAGSSSLMRGRGEGMRIIAIDPSAPLLDVARKKAGTLAGRRVFFRSEPAEPRLLFDAGVYDLVVSNLGLLKAREPRRLLSEMVRVARPGARVAATLPLRTSFAEFHDLFARALIDLGHKDALLRLSDHQANVLPSPGEARSWLAEASLRETRVDVEHFTLLFAGGRDFFFAPVIEYVLLPAWKEIVGESGPGMQAIFRRLKEEIDRHCQPSSYDDESLPAVLRGWPRPFALTVRAACLSGRKSTQFRAAAEEADEVELHTGEVDIVGYDRRAASSVNNVGFLQEK